MGDKNASKTWARLGDLQAKSFQETQRLLVELEAKTATVARKVETKEPVLKEEALGWLELRKRFLKSSINGWLLQDEMARLLPNFAEAQAAKSKALQVLSRRTQLLGIVQKAERRINMGEDIATVLTEMQEEYNT